MQQTFRDPPPPIPALSSVYLPFVLLSPYYQDHLNTLVTFLVRKMTAKLGPSDSRGLILTPFLAHLNNELVFILKNVPLDRNKVLISNSYWVVRY